MATIQTVFLIDDSEIDLFIQKRFLELNSFAERILTFSSPVKALEELATFVPDRGASLIFLDLNMPLLNGFEFLEKLNSPSSQGHHAKVVILSSSNSQEDRKRAMEFPNVINFISKPITSEGLNSLTEVLSN